jgi:hypothetical protein
MLRRGVVMWRLIASFSAKLNVIGGWLQAFFQQELVAKRNQAVVMVQIFI